MEPIKDFLFSVTQFSSNWDCDNEQSVQATQTRIMQEPVTVKLVDTRFCPWFVVTIDLLNVLYVVSRLLPIMYLI